MKFFTFPLLVCIFLFLSNEKLHAQYPVLQRFTVADGLPSSMVYSTMQDSKGYIWLGTDRGVTRFDGHKFELFTINDGLPSNDIWRISEDHKGRLWFSTFGGDCYYEDGKFKVWKEKFLPSEELQLIHDHKIISSGHFVTFSGSIDISYLSNQDSLLQLISSIDHKTSNRVFYIKKNTHTASIFDNLKSKLKITRDDDVWLINETIIYDQEVIDQIFDWNIKNVKSYISISENLGGIIYQGDLWTVGQGGLNRKKIWIRTNGKSYVVDTSFQELPNFDFLNSLSINHILFDQQNNCWISTPYGLFYLNNKAVSSETYNTDIRVSPNVFNHLAVNSQGKLWALDIEGYLYRLIAGEGFNLMSSEPLIVNPKDMVFDQDDNLWVGGNQLLRIPAADLNRNDLLTSAQFFTNISDDVDAIKKLHIDPNGEIMVANYYSIRIINKKFLEKTSIHYRGRFYDLKRLDNGSTWLAGKIGLKLISQNGKELKISSENLSELFTLPTDHIGIGKDQKLWFATNSRGLFNFDGTKIDSIPELANIIIQSLFTDTKEQIWAATNEGIVKISGIEYNPFRYQIRWFTEVDGLASKDVQDIIVIDDEIYATTDKGMTVLKDVDQATTLSDTPFFISNIQINGQDTSLQKSFDLDHTQNNILIEYRSFDYQNMGSMVFEYQMEGIDADWKEHTGFSKEYSLLPPGSYIFKLREKNSGSFKKPNVQSLAITIHPPIWKKGWFILLSAFFVSLFINELLRRKVRKVEKKSEEENQLHRRFAELELKALQSQMNPHFIFNALHAIQDFIFKKDERVANRYLVKFSRLMRLFLESSKEKYIILADEIQLLQLYIELEQLRFEDKFDFKISISPELTSSMIEIPSMLLQPFVENAINHGLIHLKKGGELLLEFSEKEGQLRCMIKDNGIGRKKAKEIKERSIKSYKSRGLQLIEERQRVWNIIGNTSVEIEIIDLVDANGIACGTQVEILINKEK